MRAILKVYLIALFVRFVDEASVPAEQMAEAAAKSTEIVHLFIAGVYAFPLIGAIIADRRMLDAQLALGAGNGHATFAQHPLAFALASDQTIIDDIAGEGEPEVVS